MVVGVQAVAMSLTAWLGRADEQEQLLVRLRDPSTRLLTIVGVGGAGKTRLALEAARTLAASESHMFPQGIFFVSLAALMPDPPLEDRIVTTIASAIGLFFAGPESVVDQLCHYLLSRRILLVLDNAEHLVAGTACLSTILWRAPDVTLLVTSRERLGLHGEHVFPLVGLPVATTNAAEPASAAQLFAQVAYANTGTFALDETNAGAVQQICHLVDGLPLGIELAANLVRTLSVQEIAQELEQNLDALATTAPDVPVRQRSLRAVFDHSWHQLSATERAILLRLAVFHGSFTRDAAAAVAGASLPLLVALIDKSLLRTLLGASSRYDLLPVLRLYLGEQIMQAGEAESIAARHAAYYANVLAAQVTALRGANQRAALNTIAVEIAQVRAAWHHAVSHADVAMLGRMTDGLFHFYDIQSWFREGAQLFGTARLAVEEHRAAPDVAALWGRLIAREGWFTFHLGRQADAWSLFERSLDALHSPADRIFSLNYGGAVRSYMGDFAATHALCHESLDLCRTLGDRYGEAIACNILGQAAYDQGHYSEARDWSERSLAIERELGNRWSMAYSLLNLGKVLAAQGQHAVARAMIAESLAIRQELGDQRGVAICLGRLGDAAAAEGELVVARGNYERSLALFREISNPLGIASALISLGRFLLDSGDTQAATAMLQESLHLAHAAALGSQVTVAEELLARAAAPARLPTASFSYDGLTARELDVLRLVAQGLTDKEVAERLIVSPRTVSTHLTAIYGKLQLNTRSAATRFAIEHGLVENNRARKD